MRAKWIGLTAAAVALVLGGSWGAWQWWESGNRKAILDAAVPPTPDLAAWPEAFRQRVSSCEERIVHGPDRVVALAELSRLYHANGFLDQAMQCYESLELLEPNEPKWMHRHAVILAGYGETELAEPLWQRVVQLAPDYTPARLRLGDTYFITNQLDEAAAIYADVLKRTPGEAYAMLGLARCDVEAERWQDARKRLEEIVARTNYQLGYDLIVTVYERLGLNDRAAAIRGQNKASSAYRDPPDPWIEEMFDDCYDLYRLSLDAGNASRVGDNAKAIRRLEQALALAPDNGSLHFQLGTIYRGMKSYSKAREEFEKTTQLAPDFADGWAHLSSVLTTLGDGVGADGALAEGLKHCPESPGLHFMNARRLKIAGRSEDAIAEYRTSIRFRGNEADPYIELAGLLFSVNRLPEAVEALHQALVAEPAHPTVLVALALYAINQGDEAGARDWIEQCRQQPRVASADLQRLTDGFQQRFGHPFR